jgi:hypothetical protein
VIKLGTDPFPNDHELEFSIRDHSWNSRQKNAVSSSDPCVSTTCHRCGACDPTGTQFRTERIPFRGARVYCPKCHAKVEENVLIGFLFLIGLFGLIAIAYLLLNPSSEVGQAGHVFVNAFLYPLAIWPSIVLHEFAHAIVGKLTGLRVLRIWIGRGRTLYRANLLGFETEFKIVPISGITFFTHGFKEKLRLRYFLAILAGPLANAIILAVAWQFVSSRNFDMRTSIQLGAIILFVQVIMLIGDLLPYRTRTAVGRIPTDGLSLFQLAVSKSPDVLNSALQVQFENTTTQTHTWTQSNRR